MILTRDFLKSIGVDVSDEDYQKLADSFEETLYQRVVDEIILELDSEKAAELSELAEADDALVQQWLSQNVEDLEEIVTDELEILLGDIAEGA